MEEMAFLICFSIKSKKFKNRSERNVFFRKLYGWKQVVPKRKRVYVYKREGILDKIPHVKIDQSSFIIPKEEIEEIEKFLSEWKDKVIWRKFKVLLDKTLEEMEGWKDVWR